MRVYWKRNRDIFLTLIALIVIVWLSQAGAFGQTTSVSRRCAGASPSPARAVVEVQKDGDVSMVPCSGRSVFVNGTSSSALLTSLNGLTAGTQLFAVPTANDTASWSSSSDTHTLRLPVTAVSGSSRTSFFPYFDAANTLAKSPFSWDGTQFTHNNAAGNATWKEEFVPSSSSAGRFRVGFGTGTFLKLDESLGQAWLYGSSAQLLGTSSSEVGAPGGNFTKMTIVDSTRTISLAATSNLAILNLGGILTYNVQRTVTAFGTVGDATINKPFGTVNFQTGTNLINITNSTATATSLVFVTPQVNDNTCTSFTVASRGAGTFRIIANANCTGETPVAFWVTN